MENKVLIFNNKEDLNKAIELLNQNNIEHTSEYAYAAFCAEEAEFRVLDACLLDDEIQYMVDNVLSVDDIDIIISNYKFDLISKDILDYDYMDDLMKDNVNPITDKWYNNFEDRVKAIRIEDRFGNKEKLVEELVDYINSFDNEDFRDNLVEVVNELEDRHVGTNEERVPGYLELRKCDVCNKVMAKGYCIENGEGYYCSDKCMSEEITREEFEELYNEGEGSSYFTEWF